MQKTLFSRHIPLTSFPQEDRDALLSDIGLFNKIKWTATRRDSSIREKKKADDAPDLRKKENKALRKNMPLSLHLTLKKEFGTDDYFTGSAVQESRAAVRSVKELKNLNLQKLTADRRDVATKLKSKKRRLTALKNIRKSLVRRSRARKENKPVPAPVCNPIEDYRQGVWTIIYFGKAVRTYENDYLFEVQYLRPAIKRLTSAIHSLTQKRKRLDSKISRLKAEDSSHICYGSKALFRKRKTVYHDCPDTWLRIFRKHRSSRMIISGRKDASGGNFLFRYDPDSRALNYRSQTKKGAICIPGVEFPHGQEDVNRAVTADRASRSAVAWCLEIRGQSLLVKCIVQAAAEHPVNSYYGNGCIAVDSNYDCLAVAETDAHGNLLHHWTIPLDMAGSSGGNEKVISKALDQVFALCRNKKKPFAMEDLSIKTKPHLYDGKKKNRHISLFAANVITWLAESKGLRDCIAVTFVDPAYTSQIGKMKYMRRYGIRIHESAAFVIARRAMGFRHERVPDWLKNNSSIQMLRTSQNAWKDIYPLTKKVRPADRIRQKTPFLA